MSEPNVPAARGALLDAYRAALDLLRASQANDLPCRLLEVLLARDAVARALSDGISAEPHAVHELIDLDGWLFSKATQLAAAAGGETLGRWRASRCPPAGAWWWWLDERAAATAAAPSPLWTIFVGFCLTISLSLTAEISTRFLSGSADFLGVFSTVVQALLTLLAGSALTEAGSRWLERLLGGFGARPHAQHRWRAALALGLLALVVGFRLALPAIARLYNDNGVRQQAAGQVTSAIASYERAINLNPDDALVHYNLATALEDILDYDAALAEYQIALRGDPKMYFGYNNLARLYILRKNDYTGALALLEGAFALEPQEQAVMYSLLKNRAWAYLGLKLHTQAEADLRAALRLRAEGAAAHCLLAQVLDATGRSAEALPVWESCIAYAGPGEHVEAEWLALARERAGGGGAQ